MINQLSKFLRYCGEKLRNNILMDGFRENLNYNLHPDLVLKETPNDFLRKTRKIHLSFLLTYFVFNFTFSLFNLDYLLTYGDIMKRNMEEGKISTLMYMLNSFPYNIFLILGSFIFFEIIAGSISYFALYIFGEKERSFKRILGIVFSSSLYVLLSFFPVLILLNIIPPGLKRDMFTMVTFLGFVFMFFILGLILQATFFIRMSKLIFQQNYGRAVLTWAFPLILFFSIIWISG